MNVYILNISEIARGSSFYKCLLDEDRQRKIERLRNDDDRLRSIAAGTVLNFALYDEGYKEVSYYSMDNGKPMAKTGDSVINYNISHSGDYAVVIIACDIVGIDIETKRKVNHKIVDKCFTKNEKTQIGMSVDADAAYTAIWTMKESFLKMTGEGIRADLSLVETSYLDGMTRWQGDGCCRETVYLDDGYVMTVCCRQNIDGINIINVTAQMIKAYLNDESLC